MTRSVQKEIERNIADQYSKIKNFQWNISIPLNEIDYPDLIIKEGGKKFGLELREVFIDEDFRKGSHMRENEKYRQKLVNQLSQKYYEATNKPIYVRILGKFGDESFSQISEYLNSDQVEVYQIKKKTFLGNCGQFIVTKYGLPEKFAEYKDWRVGEFGNYSDENEDILTQIIVGKSKKIPKYTGNITDVSLLIYCIQEYNSGKINFEKDNILNKHGFKNIYLFQYPDKGYVY